MVMEPVTARYAEDRDMLDKMMRFFRPLFLVGFAIAIVAYIAMFPKAYSELGPQGVAELLLVLPAALLCSASMGFFLGTIPAGFIWFATLKVSSRP